ncbi:MAG: polyprenyl diphosphate synthase [Minisyncoccales bacterium]
MENQSTLPRHVGLITDGNRRWAKERGLPSLEGHNKGFDAIKKIIEEASKKGIKIFTFWAFSTENWDRSKEEVAYLMDLFEKSLNDFEKISRKNLRFRIVGQKHRFKQSIQRKIEEVEKATADNKGMIVNMGMSYGGRDEIVQGFKKIIEQGINSEKITEETISDNLWMPDVDLIIRTGGEQRMSGFLAWQSTYAELFFVKKYLPDFTPADFDAVLAEYGQRQRRFGK